MSDLSFAEVEAWLQARRDRFSWAPAFDVRADHSWHALDDALDDFRLHVHTGTPLSEVVRGPHHEEQG